MADFADEGARLEQFAREESLAALSAANARNAKRDAATPIVPIDCVECGEPVPMGRLQIFPRTLRRTACADRVERHV